jgi:soluble lytic murein transglycosylase-like protein
MLQQHKSLTKKAIGFVSAFIVGGVIIYSGNLLIPRKIIDLFDTYQAKKEVVQLAESERGSHQQESLNTQEISNDSQNDITKVLKIFSAPERLVDIPYEQQSLEDLLPDKSTKNPNDFVLEEIRHLARLVPVKRLIEEYAPLYRVDPIWYAKIMLAESGLSPVAYNENTKDYGIAQLKRDRYDLAKQQVLDPKSRYYVGSTNLLDDIYNPDTNLIFGLALVRMDIDNNHLKNTDYDVISVLYNMGYSGIGEDGKFNKSAQAYLKYINSQKTITNTVIGAFRYEKENPKSITDPRVKAIFAIYEKNYSVEGSYNALLSFYMKEIEKPYKNEQWWLAGALDESAHYADILQKVYHKDEKANLEKIVRIAKEAQAYPGTELGDYLSVIYKRAKEYEGWKNGQN